jgi:hypothetical protein
MYDFLIYNYKCVRQGRGKKCLYINAKRSCLSFGTYVHYFQPTNGLDCLTVTHLPSLDAHGLAFIIREFRARFGLVWFRDRFRWSTYVVKRREDFG